MSGRTKLAGWWVVAALVAAVLGLGAREAFGSSTIMTCPNDGWNSMGSQPSYGACNQACFAAHPDGEFIPQWIESTTCCRCLL